MTVRITDDATRTEIAEAIGYLRARARRMPEHWVDRRQEIADEVDQLVQDYLAAPPE